MIIAKLDEYGDVSLYSRHPTLRMPDVYICTLSYEDMDKLITQLPYLKQEKIKRDNQDGW